MAIEARAGGDRLASGMLPARVSTPMVPVLEPSAAGLRAMATSLGLPAGGSAAELKARIAEHRRAAAGGAP